MKFMSLLLLCGFFLPILAFELPEDVPPATVKDPKEIIDIQVRSLELLQKRTALTLSQIEGLKNEIIEYKRVQELYLDNIENRRFLADMLCAAANLLQGIKNAHITDFFEPEFLSELTTLSQLQLKMALPAPSLHIQ